MMTFAHSVKTCFRKYVTFSGRASRAEYWWFILFRFGISAAIIAVHGTIFGPSLAIREGVRLMADGTRQPFRQVHQSYDGGIAGTLFSLATFLPLLAATWRRLHDTSRSGWKTMMPIAVAIVLFGLAFLTSSYFFAVLAFLSTLIALVFLLVMLAQKSTTGPNNYGPNPHEVTP